MFLQLRQVYKCSLVLKQGSFNPFKLYTAQYVPCVSFAENLQRQIQPTSVDVHTISHWQGGTLV